MNQSTQSASTTRHLEIEGMSGDTCVNKVKESLRNVPNVFTQSVKVGAATIEADQPACTAACTAINGAGYKAKESQRSTGERDFGGSTAGGQGQNRETVGAGAAAMGNSGTARRDDRARGSPSDAQGQTRKDGSEGSGMQGQQGQQGTQGQQGQPGKREGERPSAAQRG